MKERYIEKLREAVTVPLLEMMKDLRETWLKPMTEEKPQILLGKKYDDLTMEDIAKLMTVYHRPGEKEPCKFCQMMAGEEMKRWHNQT